MDDGGGGTAVQVDQGAKLLQLHFGGTSCISNACGIDKIFYNGTGTGKLLPNGFYGIYAGKVKRQEAKRCLNFFGKLLQFFFSAGNHPYFIKPFLVECINIESTKPAGSTRNDGYLHIYFPFIFALFILSQDFACVNGDCFAFWLVMM